eukprot:5960803-Pleurochrysis_carterae.AAC.2
MDWVWLAAKDAGDGAAVSGSGRNRASRRRASCSSSKAVERYMSTVETGTFQKQQAGNQKAHANDRRTQCSRRRIGTCLR